LIIQLELIFVFSGTVWGWAIIKISSTWPSQWF
jgi:hypothetical protein